MARLEAAEDESQLKIKQLESKRDSFKRQAGELQRQLDATTEASEYSLIEQSLKKTSDQSLFFLYIGERRYEKGGQRIEGEINGYGTTIH